MIGQVFHSIVNKNGIVGIRCNHRTATVGLFYRSPNASLKNNLWLEKQMIRLYTKYYMKVAWETTGQFWKEDEPCITASYTSFYGGDTLNGNKNEKQKTQ